MNVFLSFSIQTDLNIYIHGSNDKFEFLCKKKKPHILRKSKQVCGGQRAAWNSAFQMCQFWANLV